MFCTEVLAASPTTTARVSSAHALSLLVRQTPWLLADRAAAPRLLSLLKQIASLPASRLSLGLDTFHDGDRLAAILQSGRSG
jgi:hypothetical protein